jgi:hypothetical protein
MRGQAVRTFAKTVLFFLALSGFASQTLAEEFLGEEGDTAGSSEPYNYDRKSDSDRSDRATDREGSDPYSGQMYFSLGLAPGVGTFSGSLTVGYLINRYVVVDTTGYYTRIDRGDYSGEQYGPEVSLILRLFNPTILTPFIGAGPGYTKWHFEDEGKPFSDGGSVTAIVFGGLNIKLTKNFGLQVKRKQTMYLADPPRTFDDHDKREPRSSVGTSIGFYAAF